MECLFEVTDTDAPHTFGNRTITSDNGNPKKTNLCRIKLVNIRKHEGEVSATILRRDDEQKKASGSSRFEGEKKESESSRFECEPVMSSDESTNTCTEELVEDSSASEAEEIDRHAHDDIDSIDSKYEHICKICNKSFESERALYGHKRIHSDKVVKKEVPYQGGSSNQVVSNLEHMKVKWNTKGKRCQKRKHEDDFDDEMIDAAENLLYFSSAIHMEAAQNRNRDSTNSNPESFKKANEMQVGGEDGIIVASYTQQVQTYKEKFKKMLESKVILSVGEDDEIMEVTSAPNAKENVGTSSKQENFASDNDVRMEILSDKSQQKRIKLELGQTDTSQVYVCQVCNRTFSSHQALGGHTVSHNKGKNKQGEAGSKMSEHKCKICGKVYETGQSLGGHMRKHYNPDKRKSLDIGLTLLTIKEGNSESSDKLCSSNAMEESEQLLAVDEDKGKQGMGESSSENAMEETDETQAIKEDPGKDVGESSSATNPTEETKSCKHYDPDRSKNFYVGSTLQTIKEDNSNDSDELIPSNATEESEQLPTANEDKGKQGLDESSSANAMKETETEQLPTVNEDASEEVGESSPRNSADQTDETQAIKEDPGKDVGESSSATNPTEETKSCKHYDPDRSKNFYVGSTLQTIKEDNSNDSDELIPSNATEESEQLPTANEDKGKQGLDESSSANAMKETETEQLPTVNEDASEEVGESSPRNSADQTSTRPIFDLNELPRPIFDLNELPRPIFDLNELPDDEDGDMFKLQF